VTARLIRAADIAMTHRGGPPGVAEVGRAVSSDISPSMGAGVARFDRCSVEWTVRYDEVIYVVAGRFRLVSGGETIEAEPGDIVWIPEGTELRYEGEGAEVFYAVYPGDWRARAGN
jgi:ethanolamine utilization protein EutQ